MELKDEILVFEPRTFGIRSPHGALPADKRCAGTHKTKGRAEIAGTGKKMYKQKGTGNAGMARRGCRSSAAVALTGCALHAHDMPKKVLVWGSNMGSGEVRDGGLIIFANAEVAEPKTKALLANFAKLGLTNALIIDGAEPQGEFLSRRTRIPYI